jgi:hypothetical protein
MKDKKYLIIALFFIIIIGLALLVIYVDKKTPPETPKKEFKYSIDASSFFTIQNAIYEYLDMESVDEVKEVLNSKYVSENNIDLSEVVDAYYDPSFTATRMYTKSLNNKTYYYVNGYIVDRSYGSQYDYYESVNYLVIVFNNKYVINPLKYDIEYYKNTGEVDYTIDNGISLKAINTSENSKLELYISNFTNLLNIDTTRAYNMLSNNSKAKYNTLDMFYSVRDNIYNNVNSLITNYDDKENEDNITYSITLNNGKTIIIVEKDIMNYEIEI